VVKAYKDHWKTAVFPGTCTTHMQYMENIELAYNVVYLNKLF